MSITVSPELNLSHLQAMVLFALLISTAFGFLSRRTAYHRARYVLWSLVLFLLAGVGIGWLMYPLSR